MASRWAPRAMRVTPHRRRRASRRAIRRWPGSYDTDSHDNVPSRVPPRPAHRADHVRRRWKHQPCTIDSSVYIEFVNMNNWTFVHMSEHGGTNPHWYRSNHLHAVPQFALSRARRLKERHGCATRKATACAQVPRFANRNGLTLVRQADVVLGQRGHRGPGVDEVVQLGELNCALRKGRSRESGGAAWSSTRKSAPPSTRAAGSGRVRVHGSRIAGFVPGGEGTQQVVDIRGGEVSPFAPVGGTMCAASPARNRRRGAWARPRSFAAVRCSSRSTDR